MAFYRKKKPHTQKQFLQKRKAKRKKRKEKKQGKKRQEEKREEKRMKKRREKRENKKGDRTTKSELGSTSNYRCMVSPGCGLTRCRLSFDWVPQSVWYRVSTAHTRPHFARLLFKAALLPTVMCSIKCVWAVPLLWFCISHVFISSGLFYPSPLLDSVWKLVLFLL